MNKKGVTLLELLIVVAVIGILAVIATPVYLGSQRRAARSEAMSNLPNLRLLEEQYFAENGCYFRVGGVCTNQAFANVAAIQAFLPGFRPGNQLNYDYSLTTNAAGVGGTAASCFQARAQGRANTRVENDDFRIDCNNVMTVVSQ
jgi:type IV pilus assembly protein PilE